MRRTLLFAAPILIALVAFVLLQRSSKEPAGVDASERVFPLRTITLEPVEVTPRSIGYGVAEPGQTWRAVARVEGRVVEVHPELRPGGRVHAGEVLFRLDPTPYELAIARTQAEITRLEASLAENEVNERNDRAALAIEEQSLALVEKELERITRLGAEGTVSQSEVDSTTREALKQRQNVQSRKSSLALLPAQRATTNAQLAAQRASLAEANLDLEYASVSAPLDGFFSGASLDLGQFVSRGETLFEVLGSARVDIDAEFLHGDAKRMVGPEAARILAESEFGRETSNERLREIFQVSVRMNAGQLKAEWPARVIGLREDVSETTRAVVLRVSVDDPVALAIPGVRPMLFRGTFCSVELRGEPLKGALIVPRNAVRNGMVHVVTEDERLATREVSVRFEQGDFAVLESGVQAGDRVVLSDTGAAFDGARVDAFEDEAVAEDLRVQARGTEPLR